ncbi:MAG: patatin-like phospholipase family protein [Prolixibacteraceae bacterium]|nr:patatin-like phospholipase family protein [Prolixibacteraceae bacterium]
MKSYLPLEPFKNLALSLSGGGYRAATFHMGLMTYLSSVIWESKSLLERVRIISTVSGGTFTGVCYATTIAKNKTLSDFYDKMYRFFCEEDVIDKGLKKLEDFENWDSEKDRSLINALSLVYFEEFEKETFALLFDNDSHLKEIIFNATEFNYGLPFRFQKTSMVSDNRLYAYYGNKQVNMPAAAIREVRLADVIAASSCFPMGFEPINFPNDFRHKESSRLEDLKESFMADKWGKRCKFPIGLMDGGMVDNQGIDSVINAEKRMRNYKDGLEKFASKDVKAIDLYIISDVSSPYMVPYRITKEKKPEKWRRLSFKRFLFLGVLLLLTACILVTVAIFSNKTEVSFISGFFTSLFIVLGILCFFLSNIFHWAIRKFEVPEYFAKKLKVFTRMRFGVYEALMKNRITSVISMVSQVFMKQIRRQEYGRVYNDNEWKPRLIMNGIYELSSEKMKETVEDEKGFKSEYMGIPSEKLIETADLADSMGTTLWFTSQELKDSHKRRSMLNALIASGQFTGCYNLLVYIEKTLWGKENSEAYKSYHKDIQENIKNLHENLLSDWKRFNENPFWMVDEKKT